MGRAMKACLLAVCGWALAAPASALWWGPSVESVWRDRAIAVDGSDEDWRSQPKDDYEGFALSFANDEADLYILISPHTREAKARLAGTRGQDFTVWLDPKGGKEKAIGITLLAPEGAGLPRKGRVSGVRVPASAVPTSLEPEMRVGPMDARGVLELRVPLRYFGSAAPAKLSAGLEASRPTGGPAPLDANGGIWKPSGRAGKGEAHIFRAASDPTIEDLMLFQLWLRVRLASRAAKS